MRLPTINEKITLRIPIGSWRGRYSAYVEEIGETAIAVAHPMFGGGLVPLMPGDDVVVEYVHNEERLAFATKVQGRGTQEIPTLLVELPQPGAIYRHQMRDFVRLDANLPVEYLPVQGEEHGDAGRQGPAQREQPGPEQPQQEPSGEEVQKEALFAGRTMNLSGSGAQIVAHEPYPIGTRLDLVLHLPERVIFAEAQVVRVAGQVSSGEAWLGVRFTAIEERDREQIVRFVFSEQRLRRKKGLL